MKKAFTLLEFVFVIVIIGILAAAIIPNIKTNPVQEAKIQLVSHIRYAQHLGMMDDKFDASTSGATWYKNLWQIAFSGNTYSIVSNNNTLYAKDPLTQDDLNAINLNADYKITSIGYSGGCDAETDISFDHFGRPIIGDLDSATSILSLSYLTADCIITLTNGSESATITITPETGYTR